MTILSNLYTSKGSIPLKEQKVEINVIDQVANFTIKQTYHNEENIPIEAYFKFPTPGESSVYHFEASHDDENGKTIICKITEISKAKELYNEAINNNNTAYFMKREDSGDIFSTAIGNLGPKITVRITIKYVIELKNEIDYQNLRLNIPLTIMSRYTPIESSKQDHDSLSQVSTKTIDKKPFNMSICGLITMNQGINIIYSKTHKITLTDIQDKVVKFEILGLEQLDRDVIITISRNKSRSYSSCSCFVQEFIQPVHNPVYKYITAINVVPDFSKMPPVNVNNVHYIILLDSSGSMRGKDMEICKKAAQNFVALLPNESSFDVYSFNNYFDKFPGIFNDMMTKKIKASEWIEDISASGGTEIFAVLEDIYISMEKLPIRKTGVLIVLSDGGVSNTDQVLGLVKRNPHVSVFSIGIGQNVSQDLIQGLATQGNGYAEFIGSGDNDIIQKVRSQLKRSQDTLRKYQNNYKLQITCPGNSIQIPETFQPLYDCTDNMIYVFSDSVPTNITYCEEVEGNTSNTTFDPIHLNDENCMFHRIAGVKLLNNLQYKTKLNPCKGSLIRGMDVYPTDPLKEQMIQISTDLNVLSKYTAFIGVENLINKQTGKMELRFLPLQEPVKENMYPNGRESCNSMFGGGRAIKEKSSHNISQLKVSLGQPMLGQNSYNSLSFRNIVAGGGELGFSHSSSPSLMFARNTENIAGGELGFSNSRSLCSSNLFAKDNFQTNYDTRGNNIEQEMKIKKNNILNPMDNRFVEGSMDSVKIPSLACKITVNVSLQNTYIKLSGEILTGIVNRSLVLTLTVMNFQLNEGIVLEIGDWIELTNESHGINGKYIIISLGSVNEPWVLQKC